MTITLTQDGQDLANQLGISVAELTQRATDEVAREYEVYRVDDFLRSFSDATSFSNRGIGVDYASNAESIMVGAAASLAIATDDYAGERDADHPVAGVAPNLAIMGGFNFARWHHPHLTLYGNAFWRKGDLDDLSGSITSGGVHAQYKFFSPTRGAKSLVLQWGGLDVTGGLEFSRWAFGATHELDTDFDVDGTNGSTTVGVAANGQFDLTSDVAVASIEATTSLRVLYFVSVYGGVGIDFQAGKTSLDVDLQADLTATDPNDGSNVDMGTADITVNGSKGPSVGKARALAGVQVNFWKLKIFTQLNAIPISAASFVFGLRVVL